MERTVRVWWTVVTLTALLTTAGAGAPSAALRAPTAVSEQTRRGDLDGDGLSELVVAAPGERVSGSPWSGMLTVFPGTDEGLSATDLPWITRQEALGAVGLPTSQCWSQAMVTGDFNADGHGDVVVADPCEGGVDPSEATDQGSLLVLYGSPQGLRDWGATRVTWRDLEIDGSQERPRLGATMVVGDFDGDEADDLAVAAGGSQASNLWVLRGTPESSGGRHAALTLAGLAEYADTPVALAAGDVDGDGTDDLVEISQEPAAPTRSLGVRLGVAGAGLGDLLPVGELPQDVADTQSPQARLGDFDGDGRDDLAVSGHNSITVMRGVAEGLDPVPVAVLPAQGVRVLATGDFNGDDRQDLVAGRPEAVDGWTAAGLVEVFHGSRTGLRTLGQQTWGQRSPGVPGAAEDDDLFGAALFVGNFGRTRYDDLAIGVPGENGGAGGIVVLYGSSARLTSTYTGSWTQSSRGVPNISEVEDGWGHLPG